MIAIIAVLIAPAACRPCRRPARRPGGSSARTTSSSSAWPCTTTTTRSSAAVRQGGQLHESPPWTRRSTRAGRRHSQILLFLEQRQLFNASTSTCRPRPPAWSGAWLHAGLPEPEPGERDGLPGRGRDVPLPLRRRPARRLARAATTTSATRARGSATREQTPSTIAPGELPRGLSTTGAACSWPSMTDGTSQTAFFSEKLRGQGTRRPQDRHDMMDNAMSLDQTYQTCTNLDMTMAMPLTSRHGGDLGDGRDVLHDLQPRLRRRTPAPARAWTAA